MDRWVSNGQTDARKWTDRLEIGYNKWIDEQISKH